MRKSFVEVVSEAFLESTKPFLLLGDIGVHGFSGLKSQFPNRLINSGIMEQTMVGIASGLAIKGFIPTIHTIAPFLVERAFEQVKIDFGYQELPGNLVSVGASFDYSALGCTHHCPGDITLMLTIPKMNVYVPGSAKEFAFQYRTNWSNGHLNYFRLSEHVHSYDFTNMNSGLSRIKSGSLATVFVVGPLVTQVIEGLQDFDVEIFYVNEFSERMLGELSQIRTKSQVFIFEPYYPGPMLNFLVQANLIRDSSVKQIGVPREFLNHYGTYEQHLGALGLDAKGVRSIVSESLHE